MRKPEKKVRSHSGVGGVRRVHWLSGESGWVRIEQHGVPDREAEINSHKARRGYSGRGNRRTEKERMDYKRMAHTNFYCISFSAAEVKSYC